MSGTVKISSRYPPVCESRLLSPARKKRILQVSVSLVVIVNKEFLLIWKVFDVFLFDVYIFQRD